MVDRVADPRLQARGHRARVAPSQPDIDHRGTVPWIAGQVLVAALAGQHHLDVLGGEHGDGVERDTRGVGDRLVFVPDEAREPVEELVRRQHHFVMVGGIALGHHPCVRQFVGFTFGESDREGLDRRVDERSHRGGDGRRVDAPGQEHAERHVGHEAEANRFGEALRELRGPGGVGTRRAAGLREAEVPVALDLDRAVAPEQRVPRCQAVHALEHRVGAHRRAVGEVVRHCGPVEPGRHRAALDERLDLRGEVE